MRGTNQSTLLMFLVIVASVFVLMVITPTESAIVKRSFVHLGCMGKYDRTIFAKLDRVCEDCYNLYREPGLHSDCRKNCFKNEYFDGCRQALLLDDVAYDAMVTAVFGSQ
ncbi:hypothetical protein CHUAL_006860 [Chamberlinius hualienensis]